MGKQQTNKRRQRLDRRGEPWARRRRRLVSALALLWRALNSVLRSMPFQVIFWVFLAVGAAAFLLHRQGILTADGLRTPPQSVPAGTPGPSVTVSPTPGTTGSVVPTGPAGATVPSGKDQAAEIQSLVQSLLLLLGFIGVTVTAVVTYRRQRNAERQLALEETSKRAESRHQRFAKGAEMLGHDDPAIRIAGLNVIAQLGIEAKGEPSPWRQTCLNQICAYLRSNTATTIATAATSRPTLVAGQKRARKASARTPKYGVVTDEACRLIRELLDPAESHPWKPDTRTALDIDLRGAVLTTLDLNHRLLGQCLLDQATFNWNARFDGATFTGDALFGGAAFNGNGGLFAEATFTGDALFDGATFTAVSFDLTTFNGDARFDRATFTRNAWFAGASFAGATFNGEAWFDGATFIRALFDLTTFNGVSFAGATFTEKVWFDGATFTRPWLGGYIRDVTARFDGATFTAASFESATFNCDAMFTGATFNGYAWFYKATFTGDAGFQEATFNGDARFYGAPFNGDALFDRTTFNGNARFEEATFTRYARFYGATFNGDALFDRAAFNGYARFDGATFTRDDSSLDRATFTDGSSFAGTVFKAGVPAVARPRGYADPQSDAAGTVPPP